MIGLLLTLSLRSLWAHKVKSTFVGSLLAFGTFLVVAGSAFLNSIETAMERSITSSLAGDLQVYAKDAKDPLELFGGFGLGATDIGEIDPFAQVDGPLTALPEVAQVVPMGIVQTTVFGRTALDHVLEELRNAVRASDATRQTEAVGRIRAIVGSMEETHATKTAIRRDKLDAAAELADLQRVQTDGFWLEHQADLEGAVNELDTRVAPLNADAEMYFLRVIGTDVEQFPGAFDSFYVVQGVPIPSGAQGFLFSNRTYERVIKNRVAVALDDLLEAVTKEGRAIADDPSLQEEIRMLAKQQRRIVFQLGPADAAAVGGGLEELLGRSGTLDELVSAFLTVDDDTLVERHAWFYDQIAPRITLYDPAIGDDITLRAFTSSGYMRSINVRVYGTYDFAGLEKSDVWTASNLTDLVTFRQLYGKMNERELAELDDIRAAVGVEQLDRASAEDALFGGGTTAAATVIEAVAFDEAFEAATGNAKESWTRAEMRDGLALNAAVILADGVPLETGRVAVQALIDAEGWNLQVIDWQQAAGMTGQYVSVMRLVLWVMLGIIFLVALIIINNAMVTATLDRTAEIGTMRAIGAQRGTVVAVFVAETALLALLAGGVGATAAVALIAYLGQVGVPAAGEAVVMLFAGPRLYPTIGAGEVVFGMATILVVATFSALYPSAVAARIRPIVAMQGQR